LVNPLSILKKPMPGSEKPIVKRHGWGEPDRFLRLGNTAVRVSDLARPEVFVTDGHRVGRSNPSPPKIRIFI